MNNQRIKDGDQVLPGTRLGVIEEYIPGSGTFQDEDDVIYANITGIVRIDMKERKISVEALTRTPVIPQPNDIIIGEVQHVSKKAAFINIYYVGDKFCPVPFSGYIHIKQAAAGYVDQMRDVLQPGDVIKARVLKQDLGVAHLSTVGFQFGVIRASCSRCGETLHRRGNRLECATCGNIERRKISRDFGEVLKPEDTDDKTDEKSPNKVEGAA